MVSAEFLGGARLAHGRFRGTVGVACPLYWFTASAATDIRLVAALAVQALLRGWRALPRAHGATARVDLGRGRGGLHHRPGSQRVINGPLLAWGCLLLRRGARRQIVAWGLARCCSGNAAVWESGRERRAVPPGRAGHRRRAMLATATRRALTRSIDCRILADELRPRIDSRACGVRAAASASRDARSLLLTLRPISCSTLFHDVVASATRCRRLRWRTLRDRCRLIHECRRRRDHGAAVAGGPPQRGCCPPADGRYARFGT
jgi:hypothetical protein